MAARLPVVVVPVSVRFEPVVAAMGSTELRMVWSASGGDDYGDDRNGDSFPSNCQARR